MLKKKVENKKLRKTLSSFKGDNFHDLFLSLNQTMESIFTNNFNMFNKILKDVSNLKESFKEYFAKYKDYSAREKKLLIKLNEVEINKNNFFESAKKAEMSIYEYLKKKIMDKKEKPKINEDLKNNTKNDLEKYKLKLSETNEELKLFNKNQKDMFVIENEFRKNYNNLYNECLMIYFEHEEIINSLTNKIKDEIINRNNTKDEKESNNYLEKYQEKEKIEFQQYRTNVDFTNCQNNTDIKVCFKVFEEMEKIIGSYTDSDLKTEIKRFDLNQYINKIFKLDDKITDEYFDKLKDLLKESDQIIFISILNNLRAKGIYNKSERFIKFIGKAFNLILDTAQKQKNYENAKLCLILGQTFYYIDINNTKIYLFSLLKNNKWILSDDFWRNFLDMTIKKIFEKIDQSKRTNLNQSLFASLLPYVNIMVELEMDKRIIVKIVDEILQNYNYLSKENYDILFSNIDSDINKIEKYRKEGKANPENERKQ